MRILHTSDLHLGFRRYDRTDSRGVNLREADIGRAFAHLIDGAIAARPDVVVVAGDIFHSPNPGNHAIVLAMSGFARLRKALSEVPVILISGNHDSPKTQASANILAAFRELGVDVAYARPEYFRFPALDLCVFAVPDPFGEHVPLVPEPGHKHNILLLHASIVGAMKGVEGKVAPEALNAAQWNYVALGDHHTHNAVLPNAFYSGAICYTSTDVWREARSGIPKGYVLHDLDSGAHELHGIPDVRTHIDLEPLYAAGLDAKEVDAKIAESLATIESGIDGKVVRLVVYDLSVDTQRSLDLHALARYRKSALHFSLDSRRPQTISIGTTLRQGMSIGGALIAKLKENRAKDAELAVGVPESEILALGAEYLAKATEQAPPAEREQADEREQAA